MCYFFPISYINIFPSSAVRKAAWEMIPYSGLVRKRGNLDGKLAKRERGGDPRCGAIGIGIGNKWKPAPDRDRLQVRRIKDRKVA